MSDTFEVISSFKINLSFEDKEIQKNLIFILDKEGFPAHLLVNAVWYWPWLLWQIFLSGLGVARIIVTPSLPATPTLLKVRASQTTAAGRATYANSITLTPGTVTVEVEGDEFLVHALTADGAADLSEGLMDRVVTRFEGARG